MAVGPVNGMAPATATAKGGSEGPWDLAQYLDTCATTPPSQAALAAMAAAAPLVWANPSSLHGFGLAAAEALERSRCSLAHHLGAQPDEVVWCSGGTEAIQMALLGLAAQQPVGRLVISAVEHPATEAAAARLQQQGWQLARLPVDQAGLVCLEQLEKLLQPPTRLMSLIWGQSEVGSLQPLETIAAQCRRAGVSLHVDAVQVVGHQPIDFASLQVDLLSCAAHKLQGPRGIGALLVRRGLNLEPLLGGSQEAGRRGGTESVLLAVGFAAALAAAQERLQQHGGLDPLAELRDGLLQNLRALPGLRLSGPQPAAAARLPHHLSLLVSTAAGQPLAGRALVRALWRQGYAVSSGSACSALKGNAQDGAASGSASPILLAMGYGPAEAASGLRLSLGPWHRAADLEALPQALERARQEVAVAAAPI
jgi:cysteine desulfurase